MRDDDYLDPVERMEEDEREQAIAEIIGDYLERRDRRHLVRVDDLAGRAAALGPVAIGALRFAVCFAHEAGPSSPNVA